VRGGAVWAVVIGDDPKAWHAFEMDPRRDFGGFRTERLGLHTTGVGCPYVKDLDKVDLSVLENIVAESFRKPTRDTYKFPARERTQAPPAE
jgi:hypothetical protein